MPQSLQILHLEDNPYDAELIRESLRSEGLNCTVTCVDNRQDYVAALTASSPDVILADYALPTFDGQSALQIAQEICPLVPFIFVSGAIGEDKAIESLKAGATDYVFKHRLSGLAPAVRRALREVEARAERRRVVATLGVRARQQAAVAELGQQALTSTDVTELINRAVTLVTRTLDVEFCKLLQCQPDGDSLLLLAGVGWREGLVGRLELEGGPNSQAGYTLAADRPVIVEDLAIETRFNPPPLLRDHHVVSGMGVIIPGRERPFGVLSVHSSRKRLFTTDDVNFLQSTAHILASVIERKEREETLRQSRNQMEAILHGITEGITVQGRDGRFIYANETAAQLGDYASVQELLAAPQNSYVLAHEILDEWGEPFPTEQLPSRIAWQGVQPDDVLLQVRSHSGGPQRWLVLSAAPIFDDEGEVDLVINIFRDVSERTRLYQAEREARHMAEATAVRIASLQQVTAAFSQALTPSEVVQVVIEQGIAILGAHAGSVVLRSDAATSAGDMLTLVGAIGYPDESLSSWYSFPLNAPVPLAEAVRRGQAIFLETVQDLADYPSLLAQAQRHGNQSWAAIPLQLEGHTIGALGLSFAQPQRFTEQDRSFMLSLGWQCSQALERARLYDAEQRARAQAEVAHRRVQFLAEASGVLASSLDHLQTLREIALLATPRIADWTAVWLVNAADNLEPVAIGHADPEKSDWVANLLMQYATKPDEPLRVASLLPNGRAEFYPDFTAMIPAILAEHDFAALLDQLPVTSLLFVPMTVRAQITGVLGMAMAGSGRYFNPDDLALAEELARHAAMAVDNSRLYWETNRLNLELEQRVTRRTAQLEVSNQQLRRLTQRVVAVQEEERHRLSRELHDEAGQALTALKISLGLIQKSLPSDMQPLSQRIASAIALTNETMSQIRLLAHDLRPPSLDSFGLDPTLEGFCQEFAQRTQLTIHYKGSPLPPLPGAISITFYRLLQEALTNVVRHAQAREVSVELGLDGRQLILKINDDGDGFNTEGRLAYGNKPGGNGLLGMQERLDLLGGQLTIESQPGDGTRLIARAPLPDEPAAEPEDVFPLA